MLKPLTDAQVEAMKLGAVKRILRAEKAVACSGAAQVCPCHPPPHPSSPSTQASTSHPAQSLAPASNLPGCGPQLCCHSRFSRSLPSSIKQRRQRQLPPGDKEETCHAHRRSGAHGGCREASASEGCSCGLGSSRLLTFLLLLFSFKNIPSSQS